MKYAFLRTNLSLVVIGLIVGLAGGFKLANWQYRRQANKALQSSVAQASGRLPQGGNPENMTPQQREQAFNEIKAIIDKAKANPNDVEAQLDAADSFIQLNQSNEALEFLEQAQKANPNDSRTLHGLALVYWRQSKYTEAASAAKRSLELNPANTRVQLLLFSIYLDSKTNLGEAEKILTALETQGQLDPQTVTQAREDLTKARSGAGNVLDHGSKDPK